MQTYTEIDIVGYKAALARYAAKEKSLSDKWTKRIDSVTDAISEIKKFQYPSDIDKKSLEQLLRVQDLYIEFVTDIKTPADMFLTDFEMRGCK